MAELTPVEHRNSKRLRATNGHFTLTAVTRYLGVRTERMHWYLKKLGIELEKFHRKEWFYDKIYKRQYRWLTDEEVKRIIEYHHFFTNRD